MMTHIHINGIAFEFAAPRENDDAEGLVTFLMKNEGEQIITVKLDGEITDLHVRRSGVWSVAVQPAGPGPMIY